MVSLKQSISWWCYAKIGMQPETLMHAAQDIGYQAVELAPKEMYPLVAAHGLAIASTNGGMSIEQGLNRREHHAQLERQIRAAIAEAVQWKIPNVIVFSGNRDGLSDAEGAEITAEGLRRVASMAEDADVTLVMELLNSKVDHPDYQCDHVDWGIGVCQMVASLHVKLLYDIYHMQIMEGDIIRTIQTYAPYFGHYHTAGNPGRHEIGAHQELNYPAIIRAMLASGYDGYLGQEFIPTGDPIIALTEAYELCAPQD